MRISIGSGSYLVKHQVYRRWRAIRQALHIDVSKAVIWTAGSNAYGWNCHWGAEPGGATVPEYAAPARRRDLSGLPPAWIGVGSFDVLHDEAVP